VACVEDTDDILLFPLILTIAPRARRFKMTNSQPIAAHVGLTLWAARMAGRSQTHVRFWA